MLERYRTKDMTETAIIVEVYEDATCSRHVCELEIPPHARSFEMVEAYVTEALEMPGSLSPAGLNRYRWTPNDG